MATGLVTNIGRYTARRSSADTWDFAASDTGLISTFPGHRHRGRGGRRVHGCQGCRCGTVVCAGVGSMLAAALVLLVSSPERLARSVTARNPADCDCAPWDRVGDVASPCEATVGHAPRVARRGGGWMRAQCGRSRPVRALRRRRRPKVVPGLPGPRVADGVHRSRQGQLCRGVENVVVPLADPIRSSPYDIIAQAKLVPSPDAVQPTVAKTTRVCAIRPAQHPARRCRPVN